MRIRTSPLPSGRAGAGRPRGARRPAVAGQFYPGREEELLSALEALLEGARAPCTPRPVALVAPHAGYVYSGPIAADAWRQAAPHEYDVLVLLGTNHRLPGFGGVSVDARREWKTPLGSVRVDRGLAAELLSGDERFEFEPRAHDREHSIEVHVPFAQRLFPGLPILPAVVGEADPDLCDRFGRALAGQLKGRRALVVASTDLSHYPGAEDAAALDRRTLEAMAGLHPDRFREAVERPMHLGIPGLVTCACGEAPVLAAMAAARELGAGRGVVVSYANSGDTLLGEPSRVVGYGAVAFCEGGGGADLSGLERSREASGAESAGGARAAAPAADEPPRLGSAERAALLAFARRTLESYLRSGTVPLPRDLPPALFRPHGVFVSLHRGEQLRGCCGHLEGDAPLARLVGSVAIRTALSDPRFPPVEARELGEIRIEISVLSPLRRLDDPARIVAGRDGVLLRKGDRQGVLLPQVAARQGWDRETFLDQLCRKAGLDPGCWRQGVELQVFRALVFGEAASAGPPGP